MMQGQFFVNGYEATLILPRDAVMLSILAQMFMVAGATEVTTPSRVTEPTAADAARAPVGAHLDFGLVATAMEAQMG
jgi:hypothetical protein